MTPGVNVLVAAFHRDHAHHDNARAWLDAALQACLSGGRLRLLPMVRTSLVRIVTHAKVFTRPAHRPKPSALSTHCCSRQAAICCRWVRNGLPLPSCAVRVRWVAML